MLARRIGLQHIAEERIQKMIPDRLCNMVPQLVNERINPLLRQLPRGIPLTQIVSIAGSLLGGNVPPIVSFADSSDVG